MQFFDVNGALLSTVTVGALPDMLTFTHNGRRVLVANEGEPNSYVISHEVSGTTTILEIVKTETQPAKNVAATRSC